MAATPKTVDEYLAGLGDDQRTALQRLRDVIRAAAPDAEECISYGLPAFRQGKLLVGFGAGAKHCALYLMSSTVLVGFADEVEGLDIGKGTIRFAPDAPLPDLLVRRLVESRMRENEA